MADRRFLPPLGGLEVDIVELYGNFAVGSTGAVGTLTSKGIASVARASAGKYTITLSDAYNSLLWADAIVLDDTDSDPNSVGVLCRVYSEDVDSAKTVVIQFYNVTDGSAADPADGATVYMQIKLRNSSVS